MEWITGIMELASASIRPVLLAALAVILLVDIVLFRAARKKIKELEKQVKSEKWWGERERDHRRDSEAKFTQTIAERDHRIKVLEGMVASQRESMADLRDSVRRHALDLAWKHDATPEGRVAAAKKFERYLRGKE